jgi:acyl-CoA synthetase (AMP-forming)/AMP-acid ligase II
VTDIRPGTGTLRVHHLLDAAAHRHPTTTAVRDAGGSVSYAELAAISRRRAAALRHLGVRPGDRVVLHLAGGREFAALVYAVLRLGAVAVPVHPATGPLHRRWVIVDAAPRVVVTTDPAAIDAPAAVTTPDGLRDPGADAPVEELDTERVALLMYTSGSTAMPRAVVCPHERVLFAVDAILARLGYAAADVVLSRIPVSFDYGLYQLFLCARAGATLVLRPDLAEAATLATARAVGATILPIVPTLATVLLRMGHRNRGGGSIRMLTNTGATLTPALARGLREMLPAATIVPMYGMTECKRITIADPDADLQAPGVVGRPLDGTEVRIVDDAGRPVGSGTTGEILVRGPHVMDGYYRVPEAATGRFRGLDDPAGPTLHTGDLGYLDPRGRLFFVGRTDDLFKRRGVRTSTTELEAAALDIPGVSAAAVLRPDKDDVVTMYVVADLTAQRVLAAMAARVDPTRVPDRCVVLPDLPTTANGKVDRAALGPSNRQGSRAPEDGVPQVGAQEGELDVSRRDR